MKKEVRGVFHGNVDEFTRALITCDRDGVAVKIDDAPAILEGIQGGQVILEHRNGNSPYTQEISLTAVVRKNKEKIPCVLDFEVKTTSSGKMKGNRYIGFYMDDIVNLKIILDH